VMRPIVFLTDYGLGDEFVGVCHGVMERIAPGVKVIDLTHAIPREDVVQGALTLGRAVRFMPDDAVHLAVVDPGVGSDRRAIGVACASGAVLVGPDNGLLSMAWDELGGARLAAEITSSAVRLEPMSETFHGRDIFAPAGAHLAAGMRLEELGPPCEVGGLEALELPAPMVAPGKIGARVMGVDGFGNVQLNIGAAEIEHAGLGDGLVVSGHPAPLVSVFSDVPEQAVATIIDSQGFLAVVVNQGSAASLLSLRPGATVMVESD
jgi:S-adenosyl-L-methionine hydrolase (adenosine-forming)